MAFWPSSVSTDAGLYVAVNLLQTTLSGSINSAVTTVTLASTSGFPTAGAITIDNEVIFYTNISGSDLTGCVRGSDGTTAASHSSGVAVGATVVAFHHNGLKNEIIAMESWLDTHLGKGTAVTAAEFAYIAGVTSAIQTQLNLKAPLASPTFTGTVTVPTPFTVGAVSVTATGTEMNYLVGVTSALQTQLGLKAPLASPTFTGTVTHPTPFTLGAVSVTATGTEMNYLVGVTSAIQTQLTAKATDSLVVHLAGTESITGAKSFSALVTPSAGIKGISTNTNATAGNVDEYIESVVGATAFPTSTQWGDLTSISLTAGDWDVTFQVLANYVSGTFTDWGVGVSVTSGNSATGLVLGSNSLTSLVPPTATLNSGQCIANYRLSISATTTVYAKYQATWLTNAQQCRGRLCARRRQPGS